MTTFEILKPGTWLNQYDDHTINFRISLLLDALIDSFYEANQSLNLFDNEYEELGNINHNEWHTKQAEQQRIQNDIKDKIGNEAYYENFEENLFSADVMYCRKQHEKGILPDTLKRKNIKIYAKSFLFALDNFQKVLYSLVKQEDIPHLPISINNLYNEFFKAFPNLRDVRNSAHHHEDRIQGMAFGKPIDIKPLSNEFFKGNGLLILDALTNKNYGTTLANGYYGEVEISAETPGSSTVSQRGRCGTEEKVTSL